MNARILREVPDAWRRIGAGISIVGIHPDEIRVSQTGEFSDDEIAAVLTREGYGAWCRETGWSIEPCPYAVTSVWLWNEEGDE